MAELSRTIWLFTSHPDAVIALVYADLVRALKLLFDPYRPELHYMRGPGPKWHAKYDRAPRPEARAIRIRANSGPLVPASMDIPSPTR